MTGEVTIYHNPRCSKSRQALQLLKDKGVEPEIVKYLDEPPTAAELERVLRLLDLEPRELMRTKEKEYRELGLADQGLGRRELGEVVQRRSLDPRVVALPAVPLAVQQAAVGRLQIADPRSGVHGAVRVAAHGLVQRAALGKPLHLAAQLGDELLVVRRAHRHGRLGRR